MCGLLIIYQQMKKNKNKNTGYRLSLNLYLHRYLLIQGFSSFILKYKQTKNLPVVQNGRAKHWLQRVPFTATVREGGEGSATSPLHATKFYTLDLKVVEAVNLCSTSYSNAF